MFEHNCLATFLYAIVLIFFESGYLVDLDTETIYGRSEMSEL